jgi:hypothetical protein
LLIIIGALDTGGDASRKHRAEHRVAAAGASAKEAALLAALAGGIYDHAPQQNADPLGGTD